MIFLNVMKILHCNIHLPKSMSFKTPLDACIRLTSLTCLNKKMTFWCRKDIFWFWFLSTRQLMFVRDVSIITVFRGVLKMYLKKKRYCNTSLDMVWLQIEFEWTVLTDIDLYLYLHILIRHGLTRWHIHKNIRVVNTTIKNHVV